MNTVKKYNILKFLAFTLIFLIPITILNLSVKANEVPVKKTSTENAEIFAMMNTSEIGKTSIAIVSGIGIRYNQTESINNTFFQEKISAKEILANRESAETQFIINNMIATKEYYSVLKSDFRSAIKNSTHKEPTLNSIINQLDLRLSTGKKAQENITIQKKIFEQTMQKIKAEEHKTKAVINKQFKSGDTENIKASIKRYLELKEKYNYFRMHLAFADKFIEYYAGLNKYNEKLATALKLNRDIIVKGSYLVIPNDGKSVLKEYGLLYTENEIKKIIETKKEQEKENLEAKETNS